MRQDAVARVAVAVLMTLPAASCGDSSGAGQTGQAVLSVQVAGEPEETAVYRLLAGAFEKAHPQIRVRLVEVARKDDHLAKLATAFAAGDPPDVFLVNYREYSQFVTRSAVAPVGPALVRAGVDLDSYFRQPLDAFTYDGVLQCMPQNVSSLVVYYNTALFAAAGLSHPGDDWTWEEFRETARRLTTGDVRGLGIEPSIIRVAPFVWSNGGELVDDETAPTRFTLETPEARQALGFLLSLVRDDKVVPTEEEVAAQDLDTRFVTGRLGMLLSSRRETPAFREVRDLSWDVAALPVAKERAGILHSDGYCVSRDSERRDAAVRFVQFATSTQGQGVATLTGRIVPSIKAVAAGPFLDPVRPPAHAQVFLDAIPNVRRTPVIPTWPEIEDNTARILHKAFYDEGFDIDDALTEIERSTRELFAEGHRSP